MTSGGFPSIPSMGTFKKEVFEYATLSAFPASGKSAILYIAADTGVLYRWNGTAYGVLSGGGGAGSVLQYASVAAFPVTGLTAALYIATDTGLIYRWNGSTYALAAAFDHGYLTGLTDDDHPQYLNSARGDVRYAGIAHSHAVSSLTDVQVSLPAVGHVLKWDGTKWVNAIDATGGSGGTLQDGNYGHITVSVAGSLMQLNDGVVTPNKLGGTITTYGKAWLEVADAAAGRTALGLGTAALSASTAFEASGAVATHAALTLAHGISAFGSTLVAAVDASAARTVLALDQAFLLARANHTGTQLASTISDFGEAVDDRIALTLVAGANITLNYNDAGNQLTIASTGGGGGGGPVGDGSYTDITVSTSGTVWNINPNVVGLPELLDIAQNTFIGRITAGTGDPEVLTAAQARTSMGVAIGTDVQAADADLTAIAALTSAADQLPYATGTNTWAMTTLTTAARALLDDVNASAQRATLGLVIGTDVQGFSANLAAMAGLASAADRVGYFTGSGAMALATFTAQGRALVDDVDAAAQRTTLGLGTAAVLNDPGGGLVGVTAAQVLTNKTLTAPIIATIVNGGGTLTLPSSTDTLVGRATADTLTNKTYSAPVFTGLVSTQGASVLSANALGGGTVIDTTRALNTKSTAVDVTLTFSGAPASPNTVFGLHITNTDTLSHVITIPTSKSLLRQGNITTFTMPASSEYSLQWRYDGTNYVLMGEPPPYADIAEQSVASAATVDLGASPSTDVSITGTVTITSFGTASAGTYRQGRFTGALTLTHNATSMILPSTSNIPTAANDRFGAYSLGSGNWLVLWYTKANGQAVVAGAGISDGDKGDITASGAGSVWTIDAGVVTLAKQADLATARVIGRATAGTGVPESLTLSQVLDMIGSAAQGDVLYRGAATWSRLGAGTIGQFLQTQGAGANPQWSTPAGAGDASTNTATSVDSELVLFSSTTGKLLKRAALTGLVKATSGVASAATQGSDYYAPTGTDVAVADGGTGLSAGTSGGVLAYTAAGVLASSLALAANALVLGGGAGVVPKTVAGIASDGTSQLQLGVAGSSVGSVQYRNATSGTITVQPVTGALGTITHTLPALTGTYAMLGNKLSDFAATTSAELAGVISDETGTGALVFGTRPTVAGALLHLNALPTSNNTYEGHAVQGINAGATIAQWEAVYLQAAGTWALADANGSGTYPCRGLAVAAYVNTNAAIVLDNGIARNDTWAWTPGGDVYLSTTAGGLTQTAPSTSGDKVQKIGYAVTADSIRVNIGSGEYLTRA